MQTAPIKPLKPWFQTIEDVGDSLNWPEFFGNNYPVQLDIGCGRGLFVVDASQRNANTNYLGIEIDYREGRRGAMRLLKRRQQNARIIGGDCNVILSGMIESGSVAAAHVYFPDPWWKKRHHKRRLFTSKFVDLLAQVVACGGHVHSWSDVAEYFEIIQRLMDDHPEFKTLSPPKEREPKNDMDYRTSFERKKRQLGLPVYRGLWERVLCPVADTALLP